MKTFHILIRMIVIFVLPFGFTNASRENRNEVLEATQQSTYGWDIQTVDRSPVIREMIDRHMVLDDHGHPHIVYGGDRLYYTWYDGSQWHDEVVDNTPGVQYASLGLRTFEAPVISYYDSNNQDLKCAWREGLFWHIETVDSEGNVGQHASISINTQDHPAITYKDTSKGDLKYALYDGAQWHIETVDNAPGGMGESISLVIDDRDRPHIAYTSLSGDLKYAWYDGIQWHIQVIERGGVEDNFSYASLAVERATGNPHISYCHWEISYSGGCIEERYARYNGSEWKVEILKSGEGVGAANSIALDNSGHARISFNVRSQNPADNGLNYAWFDGTKWHIENVAPAAWVLASSLSLDQEDRPHISYMEYTSNNLTYTWYDGLNWNSSIVASSLLSTYSSLALDEQGWPRISYRETRYYGGNSALRYAWFDGTDWHIDIVDTEGQYTGYFSSLVLDSGEHPHIGYSKDNAVMYAWNDGSIWQSQVVEDGTAGEYITLALDRNDRPRIVYEHFGTYDLYYAWHDGTLWHLENVDTNGDVVSYPTMVLDFLGNPHVAYMDRTNALKYGWHDGTIWHFSVVDTEAGAYPSIALDQNGYPHISYIDGNYPETSNLKYAWYDGSQWHQDVVDSVGYASYHTSLALAGDRPYISYHNCESLNPFPPDCTKAYQKFAWYDGMNWRNETLDVLGGIGNDSRFNSSLEIDPLGNPHIGYSKGWDDGSLRYARRLPSLNLQIDASPLDGFTITDTLSYTIAFNGPGLTFRLYDPLPLDVGYVAGSITGTVAPSAVYSPTIDAITWEGTILTNTIDAEAKNYISFQVTSIITGTETSSRPVVNTVWLTDTTYRRHASYTVIVNGWRVYLPVIWVK